MAKEKEIFNREKYNDGKWHTVSGDVITALIEFTLKHRFAFFVCVVADLQVMFSLEKKKFRLVVDGIRAQDGQLTNAELASMQHFVSPVYLGSAPEAFHKELKVIYTQSRQN